MGIIATIITLLATLGLGIRIRLINRYFRGKFILTIANSSIYSYSGDIVIVIGIIIAEIGLAEISSYYKIISIVLIIREYLIRGSLIYYIPKGITNIIGIGVDLIN